METPNADQKSNEVNPFASENPNKALREQITKLMNENVTIDGYSQNVSGLSPDKFKIHKVKKGAAKGVLGFENVTEGENTFTKVVFKPFIGENGTGTATISESDLTNQPLFNFKGDGNQQKIERAIASNSIANIADAAYDATGKGNDDIGTIKTEKQTALKLAFKNTDGTDAYGPKTGILVGGKSKRRRIIRRKTARRRKLSRRRR